MNMQSRARPFPVTFLRERVETPAFFVLFFFGKTDPKRPCLRRVTSQNVKHSNLIFEFQPLEACSAPKWSRAPNPKTTAR